MLAWGLAVVLSGTSWAQVTQRVSVDTSGAQASGGSSELPSISADGRYVAFQSSATNLVAGDTNGWYDVFVRDRQSGTTERASVDSGEAQGFNYSTNPSISADGRYVAFESYVALVPEDSNGLLDVYVRDRQSGTTERVSVDSAGAQGDGHSYLPSISADGRYVAFSSQAVLVPGDTNGNYDVFVRDRLIAATERVSVDSGGGQAFLDSFNPSISADGRYVAFESLAPNLVPGDTNGWMDIFVRDRQIGTTERVSVSSGGAQADSFCELPSISDDGRYVAFQTQASTLVPGDTNGWYDVFVRDRQTGTTERVSVGPGGVEGNFGSSNPSISDDGRYVAFNSSASNLVPADTNGSLDVLVRDRQSSTTERVSVDSGEAQGNDQSSFPSISDDGRYVAFSSAASNLVPGDTNGLGDVFVRDRLGGTAFTSLCDPGVGGVLACPCANPPVGTGRGCNNSSATGGAILSASGGTYLSSDSLVFTTSAEKPTALSIVLQGTSLLSSGVVFGQGVRCAGGTLKRLYTKTASAGSITAPDFEGGDPTVSSRSAALGNPILAGQSRWYLVFYRDPVVLGGCPSTSTFNATQTGRVSWEP